MYAHRRFRAATDNYLAHAFDLADALTNDLIGKIVNLRQRQRVGSHRQHHDRRIGHDPPDRRIAGTDLLGDIDAAAPDRIIHLQARVGKIALALGKLDRPEGGKHGRRREEIRDAFGRDRARRAHNQRQHKENDQRASSQRNFRKTDHNAQPLLNGRLGASCRAACLRASVLFRG